MSRLGLPSLRGDHGGHSTATSGHPHEAREADHDQRPGHGLRHRTQVRRRASVRDQLTCDGNLLDLFNIRKAGCMSRKVTSLTNDYQFKSSILCQIAPFSKKATSQRGVWTPLKP